MCLFVFTRVPLWHVLALPKPFSSWTGLGTLLNLIWIQQVWKIYGWIAHFTDFSNFVFQSHHWNRKIPKNTKKWTQSAFSDMHLRPLSPIRASQVDAVLWAFLSLHSVCFVRPCWLCIFLWHPLSCVSKAHWAEVEVREEEGLLHFGCQYGGSLSAAAAVGLQHCWNGISLVLLWDFFPVWAWQKGKLLWFIWNGFLLFKKVPSTAGEVALDLFLYQTEYNLKG